MPFGLRPSNKDETQPVASGLGLWTHRNNEYPNSASEPAAEQVSATDIKLLSTLRARFALLGFALLEISDGSLLVTKWNLYKPLQDYAAAKRFLHQIGGAANA